LETGDLDVDRRFAKLGDDGGSHKREGG
jgi:hypothetical protein